MGRHSRCNGESNGEHKSLPRVRAGLHHTPLLSLCFCPVRVRFGFRGSAFAQEYFNLARSITTSFAIDFERMREYTGAHPLRILSLSLCPSPLYENKTLTDGGHVQILIEAGAIEVDLRRNLAEHTLLELRARAHAAHTVSERGGQVAPASMRHQTQGGAHSSAAPARHRPRSGRAGTW